MDVYIPESEKRILRRWLEMDATAAGAIERAVSGAKPSMTRAGLVAKLSAVAGVAPNDADDFARVFVNMAATMTSVPQPTRPEFTRALVAKVFAESPSPPDAVLRIDRLVSLPALETTAKARELLGEHQHVFEDCRILTDLRPIFPDDDTEIRAATVIHELRLSYGEARDTREFYVALNASDLRSLRTAVDRALAKQASLEAFANRAGAATIGEDSE